MNFIIAGLSIIYITICGFGLIKLLLKDNIPFSLFGLIPLSFGAGLGEIVILGNLLMFTGLRLSFWTLYMPLFILFAYALHQLKIKRIFRLAEAFEFVKGFTWMEWIFILVIVFGVSSAFLMSVTFPLHFWDSRAIWGAMSKMLFFDGTVHSSFFMDPSRINAHFQYPLLFPMAQAFIYFALGQADDWAIMVLIGIIFPMLVLFLFDLARIYINDREKALAAAAMMAVLPVFFMSEGPVTSGFADPPLAMLYCLSLGITLLWKRNKYLGYLMLSAFLSGILMLTKNEGVNMILLNMILIALPDGLNLKNLRIKEAIMNIMIFASIVMLILAPWFMLIRTLPAIEGLNILSINFANLLKNIEGIPFILNGTVNEFIGLQKNMMGQQFIWCILWAIFIFTSIISLIFRLADAMILSLITIAYVLITILQWIILPAGTGTWLIDEAINHISRQYQGINAIVVLQIASTLKHLGSDDSQNR